MSGLLHDLLMSIGFTRRILVSREQRRLELENRKWELKTEFAFYCQDGVDGKQFYTANPDKFAEVKAFGIDKELPTARDCRIFLYGEDINETIESCVPPVKQMPNSVEVVENEDGSKSVKVIAGERFYYFSPFAPAFNSNYTKFLWNDIVYEIPQEYYGMPVNRSTMYRIAQEIVKIQNRLIDDIAGVI